MENLIAYNCNDLDAQIITEKAANWHKKGALKTETWAAIKAHYATYFYSPNVFMRVGAFIFCCLLVFAFFGIIVQFNSGNYSGNGIGFTALVTGILCFVALEYMIKEHHFKSGIDDALLCCGLGFVMSALFVFFNLDAGNLTTYFIVLPLFVFAAIRYLDTLMTAVSYVIALTIVVLTAMKFPTLAPSVLSFVVATFAIFTYFMAEKVQKNDASRFWKENLDLVEALSLALFYASCNYFILQQASKTFFDRPTIALAPLFWFLTFAIPIFYIYQGLKQKNRLILSTGFLAIAAGVATFRAYFHVVPMEIAAIISGIILLSIAYFSIQYLKKNKTPFTYEEDDEKPFYQQAESLIIAQSLGNVSPQNEESRDFGGGDFGGGGAGQGF
jgi:uncharacterized membrane protein YgcG